MSWQPAPLLFPDLELWATAYLRDALDARPEQVADDVYVSNAVPKPRRDQMVIVRRDGGQAAEHIDNGRLSMRVWATTEQDATDLARLVSALLWAAPDGAPVVRVTQMSGPTPVVDESKQALRYLVFEVATRGEAIA